MTFSTKEDAILADKVIQSLIDKQNTKGEPTIYPNEVLEVIPELTAENLKSILEIIRSYQNIHRYSIFSNHLGSPNGIDIGDSTRGFMHIGGFTNIWEKEEQERQSKAKVDTVNQSVLETNKTVRFVSFISAITALLSLVVAILAYNNTADINVKSLPQPPIQSLPVQVTQKPIDTVYLLNPAPLQSQPTNPVNTSKTHK